VTISHSPFHSMLIISSSTLIHFLLEVMPPSHYSEPIPKFSFKLSYPSARQRTIITNSLSTLLRRHDVLVCFISTRFFLCFNFIRCLMNTDTPTTRVRGTSPVSSRNPTYCCPGSRIRGEEPFKNFTNKISFFCVWCI